MKKIKLNFDWLKKIKLPKPKAKSPKPPKTKKTRAPIKIKMPKIKLPDVQKVKQIVFGVFFILCIAGGICYLIINGNIQKMIDQITAPKGERLAAETTSSDEVPVISLGVREAVSYIFISPCKGCPATTALGPGTYTLLEQDGDWCRIELETESWVSCSKFP